VLPSLGSDCLIQGPEKVFPLSVEGAGGAGRAAGFQDRHLLDIFPPDHPVGNPVLADSHHPGSCAGVKTRPAVIL
jgi:hypothetical protein